MINAIFILSVTYIYIYIKDTTYDIVQFLFTSISSLHLFLFSSPLVSLSQMELADLLKPISEKIQEIQNFRERNRGSSQFNHLSAVSESIPALGWVAVVRRKQTVTYLTSSSPIHSLTLVAHGAATQVSISDRRGPCIFFTVCLHFPLLCVSKLPVKKNWFC